jgi:hypothetical protein
MAGLRMVFCVSVPLDFRMHSTINCSGYICQNFTHKKASVTWLWFWFQVLAAKPSNPPNDNQAAAGSETPVNIKAEANKTSVARNLKIIIAPPFYWKRILTVGQSSLIRAYNPLIVLTTLAEILCTKSRFYRALILVLLIASRHINSTKNNQEAASSETLASIKVKTNKTTIVITLKIITATLFYVENESSLLCRRNIY